MFNPEVTLRIIRHSTSSEPSRWHWGVKAVERRMGRCCADNPECILCPDCCWEYVRFVDATEDPKSSYREKKSYHSMVEPCTLHGIKIYEDMVRY